MQVAKRRAAIVAAAGAAAVSLLSAGQASAGTSTWSLANNGNWNVGANWNTNPTVPGASDQAVFNAATGRTVTLTADQDIDSLLFSNTGAWNITGSPNTLNLANGITLDSSATAGTKTISSKLALTAAQTWSTNHAGNNLIVSGVISGTNNLTLAGPGAVTLTGNNSGFSGDVTVSSHTSSRLYFNTANALGTGKLVVNSPGGTIANYGSPLTLGITSLDISADARWGAFSYGSSINTGTGPITLSGDRIIATNVGVGFTLTLGGNITGGNNITAGYSAALGAGGNGRVIIGGSSNWSGTTTSTAHASYKINPAGSAGGTFLNYFPMFQFAKRTSLYNADSSKWTDSNLIVDIGAGMGFNVGGTGEFTASDIDLFKGLGTATGGFKNGSYLGLDTSNAGGSFTYNSNIADNNGGANKLSLWKVGTGTLKLGGTNTFTGTIRIGGGGTVEVTDAAALPNSTNNSILFSANTNAGFSTPGAVSEFIYTGGTNWSGNINLGVGASTVATLKNNSATGTMSFNSTANVGGGSGSDLRWVLGGTNTGDNAIYNKFGTMSNAVNYEKGLDKVDAGKWILANTDNRLHGVVSIKGGILGAMKLANQGVNSSIGYGKSGAAVTDITGTTLVLDGGTLQYLGTGDSTNRLFTVGSTLAGGAGTLDASGTGALNFTNTGVLLYGTNNQARTLTLSGTSSASLTNTMSVQLVDNGTGALNLVKNGSNTWVLNSSASTYSGGTVVSNGTLLVNNTAGSGTGTGTVTVGSGATLGGTGSIAGDVDITGNLAPGASVGTLTVNNDVVFNAGGKLVAEINNDSADLLAISGNLDLSALDGGVDVTFTGTQGQTRYVLATYTGSLSGTFDSLTVHNGSGWSMDYGTTGEVAIAVPEPASVGLLGLVGLGALGRRRRRA